MAVQAELTKGQIIYLAIAEYKGKNYAKPFLASEAYKLVNEKLGELKASQSRMQKNTFIFEVNEMLANQSRNGNLLGLHLTRKFGKHFKDVTGKQTLTADNFDDDNLYLSVEKLG